MLEYDFTLGAQKQKDFLFSCFEPVTVLQLVLLSGGKKIIVSIKQNVNVYCLPGFLVVMGVDRTSEGYEILFSPLLQSQNSCVNFVFCLEKHFGYLVNISCSSIEMKLLYLNCCNKVFLFHNK